ENPFRNVGGPRAIPGTYTVTVSAGGRTGTRTVTVEPDPILGGDPARFAAQLRAGLEWRNAMSALNEMLNRIASLETQLKNTQQALRDNTAGDTATAAPVSRQARELGRKLKELKDSLYNSDVQRDAGQDDIHYLNRFQDRLQGLGFGLAFAYAQPPNEVVAAPLTELLAVHGVRHDASQDPGARVEPVQLAAGLGVEREEVSRQLTREDQPPRRGRYAGDHRPGGPVSPAYRPARRVQRREPPPGLGGR